MAGVHGLGEKLRGEFNAGVDKAAGEVMSLPFFFSFFFSSSWSILQSPDPKILFLRLPNEKERNGEGVGFFGRGGAGGV